MSKRTGLSLQLQYALRDLRGSLKSFRIILMCLILGVGAIASVQFISRSVLDAIARDGRIILGADMIVRTTNVPAPDNLKIWFEKQGGQMTQSVEMRAMLANAVTQDNVLVELKAVDAGYPQYGVFETDAGNDLHALLKDGGAVLDPALRARLGLKTGDQIRMGQGVFTVRAFIVTEPDRAGGSRFGIAPRAIINMASMQQTGFTQTGSMSAYDLRVKLPAGTSPAPVREALKKEFPGDAWRVTDADNAAPRITSFIEKLMLFLTLVGLSALLIGGIGIGNGTRAHLESRMKTIAIFKSLGATQNFVSRIYFVQIALVALLGTGLGVLLGVGVPYAFAPALSDLLPFTIIPSVAPEGVFVPVLFGLLVSAVFVLWPLGQAAQTSPLALFRAGPGTISGQPSRNYRIVTFLLAFILAALAVASARDGRFALWFVVGAGVCLAAFWFLGKGVSQLARRVPAPRNPAFRIALRNLYRPGNATAGTLVSLGLGLTVLMSITLIELNLRQGIVRNLPDDAPAFFFIDIQRDQKDAFEKLLSEQPSAQNIKFSANLRGRIVSVNGKPAAEALVDEEERWLLQNDRGFTYTNSLPAHSEVTAGEWWPADYKGPPLVSVVEDVERGFGVKPGDKITVNILGRDITATIANVRSVNWMNFTINFAITFAPGTLEAAPHSWLATVVADPAQEAVIQRNLSAAFPNITMIRLSDAVEAAGGILGNMATAVRITALVAVITGILVLAGSLAATRTQRLYDTVVLKVLGVRNRTLLAGFLAEFGALGVLAGLLSLALGCVVSWAVMVPLMDLGWHFYVVPALLTGGAGLVLTLVIGWVVTGRVLSAPAAPHLRNE